MLESGVLQTLVNPNFDIILIARSSQVHRIVRQRHTLNINIILQLLHHFPTFHFPHNNTLIQTGTNHKIPIPRKAHGHHRLLAPPNSLHNLKGLHFPDNDLSVPASRRQKTAVLRNRKLIDPVGVAVEGPHAVPTASEPDFDAFVVAAWK